MTHRKLFSEARTLWIRAERYSGFGRCFEPKCFPIREVIKTPLILYSGGGLAILKGGFVDTRSRIEYLILDIMLDKFVGVRIC